MTKAIAELALIALMWLVTLANYWFAFGLWPKSWLAYCACFAAALIIVMLQMAIRRDDK